MESLARQVNPFIGTDGPGNVYPGASAPFGMVQLSPDNGTSGWDRIAGYFYPDTTIAGFSMTHLSGTGAGDLYDVSFMPATWPLKIGKGELGIYSTFSHDNERAWAGYYEVVLRDYGIKVELTASERCGFQRYTFPRSDSAFVFLNLKKSMNWDATKDAQIRVVDSVTVEGYRHSSGWAADQRVYFVTRFSTPFRGYTIKDSVARFEWATGEGEQIEVQTAISGVSIEGARKNFESEADGQNFNDVQKATEKSWNDHLARIAIEGGSKDERVSFYTAMYRTMIAPTIFSDVDGSYRGADGAIHQGDFTNYSTFSLWDTYRTAHPLLTITNPARVKDMVSSMLAFYDEHGALPVWNLWGNETDMMIGYHSVPVIVEAYLKGVPMDAQRALAACVATASQEHYRGLGTFAKLGYVPADDQIESVSKTIEYAYDDHCIAVMAAKMGKTEIADRFARRSKGYVSLFNKESRFFEPKSQTTGTWLGGFDPKAYTEHFTESNAWQYRFAVQQDVGSMIDLMGGPERFEAALDSMFAESALPTDSLPIFSTGMIGQYVQGNEPSHHVAYLYNYVGRPEKTAAMVLRILRGEYKNNPGGLCGNEDCGQMSAWYVMSAMGFYPVDPVSLEYALGVPLFDKTTIRLDGEKTFVISRVGKGDLPRRYILNGEALTAPFITWAQITAGGELNFEF